MNTKSHDEIPEDYIFETWGYRIWGYPFGRDTHIEVKSTYLMVVRKPNGVQSIDNMKSLKPIGIPKEMATFIG